MGQVKFERSELAFEKSCKDTCQPHLEAMTTPTSFMQGVPEKVNEFWIEIK